MTHDATSYGTTRSDAGPILGLAALGLTMAFVALGRSKPAKVGRTGTSGRPWQPTCAITWPAQIRPSRWSRACAMPTGEAPKAPSSSPCTNSFAKTEPLSRGSCSSSDTPRGQPNDWRAGRLGVPFAWSLAARLAICRCSERSRRSPLACRASDVCGGLRRLLFRFRIGPAVGALSNSRRMRSGSGRPSSGIGARSSRLRSVVR